MNTHHRALTFLGTLTAGAMIAASTIATAHAEPAPIDDGSGPISNGAPIEDGSGTPGPSYDEPVSIPSVGPAPIHTGPGTRSRTHRSEEAAGVHPYGSRTGVLVIARSSSRGKAPLGRARLVLARQDRG